MQESQCRKIPYTYADATFRHVSEFIPEQFQVGEHFELAKHHAEQVRRSSGQAKYEHQKNTVKHLLEGLNDQSSS